MKAPAFDYLRVSSLDEALSALREHGDEAKIIAGGQSLVPALNLRLAAPALLVDIGRLEELRTVSVEGRTVSIGALVRHVEIERSHEIARHLPLLSEAVRHVAHPAIRNRGTFGGSIANADPASEFPACVLALGGTIVALGSDGERRIAAGDVFTGFYETALKPDEILVRVEIPADGPASRFAFHELARRSGDYAMVGLAARADVSGGTVSGLRIAYFGVGDRPTLAAGAAGALAGGHDAAALAAAKEALAADLEPQDDLNASAPMRLHLARVLLGRALADLNSQTTNSGEGGSS